MRVRRSVPAVDLEMPKSASLTLMGVRDARSTFCRAQLSPPLREHYLKIQDTHLRLQIPMADMPTMQDRESIEKLVRHRSGIALLDRGRLDIRGEVAMRNILHSQEYNSTGVLEPSIQLDEQLLVLSPYQYLRHSPTEDNIHRAPPSSCSTRASHAPCCRAAGSATVS